MARKPILTDSTGKRPPAITKITVEDTATPVCTPTQRQTIAQCEHTITACRMIVSEVGLWLDEFRRAADALEVTVARLRNQTVKASAVKRAVHNLEQAL